MVKRATRHSASASKNSSNDVGYARPPKPTQFRKGQSGNPSGRPKGRLNLATVVAQAISAKVVVTEGGRRVTKSKLEVSITQLANKAASGDLNAMRLLLNLMPLLEGIPSGVAMTPDLAADRELALKVAARLAGQLQHAPPENVNE